MLLICDQLYYYHATLESIYYTPKKTLEIDIINNYDDIIKVWENKRPESITEIKRKREETLIRLCGDISINEKWHCYQDVFRGQLNRLQISEAMSLFRKKDFVKYIVLRFVPWIWRLEIIRRVFN